MSDTSRAERQLSERFGFTADGSWMRRSSAAAMIATGDWALEWPLPIPPKVHVSHIILNEGRRGDLCPSCLP